MDNWHQLPQFRFRQLHRAESFSHFQPILLLTCGRNLGIRVDEWIPNNSAIETFDSRVLAVGEVDLHFENLSMLENFFHDLVHTIGGAPERLLKQVCCVITHREVRKLAGLQTMESIKKQWGLFLFLCYSYSSFYNTTGCNLFNLG